MELFVDLQLLQHRRLHTRSFQILCAELLAKVPHCLLRFFDFLIHGLFFREAALLKLRKATLLFRQLALFPAEGGAHVLRRGMQQRPDLPDGEPRALQAPYSQIVPQLAFLIIAVAGPLVHHGRLQQPHPVIIPQGPGPAGAEDGKITNGQHASRLLSPSPYHYSKVEGQEEI